jgi:DNA-directed RNA polymerase subunit RPC12/RpoP
MVLTYKCPNCGGEMAYDNIQKKLVCANCGTTKEVDDIDKTSSEKWNKDINAFKCESCGAELITNKVTAATFCSFCGASTIISSRLSDIDQPAMVIPFKINKDQTVQAFKKWCRNGLVTPKDFTSADRIEKISGIYVPFWLYDCGANADIQANCTSVRSYRRGDTEYTETSHYIVYRNIDANYIKIPADASEQMEDGLMDKLEPYNYAELTPFKTPYLSGYLAEKYGYTNDEMFPRIQQRVDRYIEDYTRSTINGYSTVMVTNKNINSQKLKADYVLLPVWILNYNYKNKHYTFAMNGQTGKIVGKPPISFYKVATWAFVIGLVTFIISSVIGGFLL